MSTPSSIKAQETPADIASDRLRVDCYDGKYTVIQHRDGLCAALLGVSKNAAIGKLKRLGLLGAPEPPKATSTKPKPVRKTAFRQPSTPVLDAAPIADDPSDGIGIHLFDLTNATCRWPKGTPGEDDFCFCGRDGADLIAARPYCAEHTRAARK